MFLKQGRRAERSAVRPGVAYPEGQVDHRHQGKERQYAQSRPAQAPGEEDFDPEPEQEGQEKGKSRRLGQDGQPGSGCQVEPGPPGCIPGCEGRDYLSDNAHYPESNDNVRH